MTDSDLLQNYAANRSDDAFRMLIERYIRLVYSACCRQLKDPHLAEDATQAVFILLSRKAGSLRQDRISGWLLTTARYACANIRKTERRRQHREQVIAMQRSADTGQRDHKVLELLDEALGHLAAADREAVVLRYLRDQSLREVGETMGVTEEAARKRVDRAVEKLRHYFARRGIATTAAALATLLPAQGQAAPLISALQESLTHTILQTCHAGAAIATPAMAIAKGTNMMMLANTFKSTAIGAFLFAIVVLAGWWGVWAVSRTSQAQTATTTPAITLDLSTPEKALQSYCDAMTAGDRAAVYACTTIDPNRTPTTGDAFIALNLGQNRLIRAAAKAFNSKDEQVRRFPGIEQVLEKVLAYDRSKGETAIITGDSATLPFQIPEGALANFPTDVQAQVRDFIDHPMQFTRQGKDWKLGPSQTQVVISLKDNQGLPVMDEKTQIAVVLEYAAIYDHVAGQVESGEFASLQDAQIVMRSEIKDLHQKYNLADINVQMSPKQPTSGPASQH